MSHLRHSYSLLNYLEIKENGKSDIYFSILNPWRDQADYYYEGIDSNAQFSMTHLPNFNEKENIVKKSIIEDVNKHYTQTGHMILKDDFFLKWFLTLNFCESMFGAKELLIERFEDEVISIKVMKDSKVCIEIFGCIEEEKKAIRIKPYLINEYICFNLEKIKNDNLKEKVKLSDNLVTNKIY